MTSTLKTARAEPCFVDKVTDSGAGQVWYVRLGDGYLMECSTSARAYFVCAAINALIARPPQDTEAPHD